MIDELPNFSLFMHPILNPYAPDAGRQTPELDGCHAIREHVRICIERLRHGRQTKSVMLVGLRGVGKTVLLDKMRDDAEKSGVHTIRIEAPENRSLPAILAPQLRLAMLRLSRIEAAKSMAIRGLRALAGFAGKLKFTYSDIEVGIDYDSEPGLADNGDLEGDLTALLEQTGMAARAAQTVLVIFIDELQYVPETQLAALISALHRCSQSQLPVTVIGAGLPQLRAQMGDAKSYAERLFDFREIALPNYGHDVTSPAEKKGADSIPDTIAPTFKTIKGEGAPKLKPILPLHPTNPHAIG